MSLTLEQIEQNGKIREITTLTEKNKKLINVDSIGQCIELRRLDLSQNEIPALSFISKNFNLTTLNLSSNKIKEIGCLTQLNKLTVLNLSNNLIKQIKGLDGLINLKALLLNNNQISSVQGLDKNIQINTLVLSHNKISQAHNLDHLYQLVKLSLSHNQLKSFKTGGLESLEELRLNDNEIQTVDKSLSNLTLLKLLDLGRNKITSLEQFISNKISSLEKLNTLEKLTNFNILGNTVQNDVGFFRTQFPRLKIYNSRPVHRFQASVVFDRQERVIKKKVKVNPQVQQQEELEADFYELKQVEVEKKKQAIKSRKGKSAQVRLTNHSLDAETKKAIQRTKNKIETVLESTNKFDSWD